MNFVAVEASPAMSIRIRQGRALRVAKQRGNEIPIWFEDEGEEAIQRTADDLFDELEGKVEALTPLGNCWVELVEGSRVRMNVGPFSDDDDDDPLTEKLSEKRAVAYGLGESAAVKANADIAKAAMQSNVEISREVKFWMQEARDLAADNAEKTVEIVRLETAGAYLYKLLQQGDSAEAQARFQAMGEWFAPIRDAFAANLEKNGIPGLDSLGPILAAMAAGDADTATDADTSAAPGSAAAGVVPEPPPDLKAEEIPRLWLLMASIVHHRADLRDQTFDEFVEFVRFVKVNHPEMLTQPRMALLISIFGGS